MDSTTHSELANQRDLGKGYKPSSDFCLKELSWSAVSMSWKAANESTFRRVGNDRRRTWQRIRGGILRDRGSHLDVRCRESRVVSIISTVVLLALHISLSFNNRQYYGRYRHRYKSFAILALTKDFLRVSAILSKSVQEWHHRRRFGIFWSNSLVRVKNLCKSLKNLAWIMVWDSSITELFLRNVQQLTDGSVSWPHVWRCIGFYMYHFSFVTAENV